MGPPSDQDVMLAVRTLARRLRDELGAERVLLFGSRARGDHLVWSDVDLLVVSPAFEGQRFDDRMVSVFERWNGPVALEPLCLTPGEFEQRRDELSIIRAAVREGRPVA